MLADYFRAAAEDIDRIDANHADDTHAWTLEALEVIGDTWKTLTPLSDFLLFFGHEFGRVPQTTMAARIGLTSSTLSRRLAVARSKVNMAEWWAEHQ